MRTLTAEHVQNLVPHLRARDRYEIEGLQDGDHAAFLYAIAAMPGSHAWAFERGGETMAIGGVITAPCSTVGYLWLHAREGWERHAKHALRALSVIEQAGGYRRLELECYEDNARAKRFAERLGYEAEGVKRAATRYGTNLVVYGKVL